MRLPHGIAFALALTLACAAGSLGAQTPTRPLTWATLVGTWRGHSYKPHTDTAIASVAVRFSAGNTVTVQRNTQTPAPATVVTMGGDSVVVQYDAPSVIRTARKVVVRETYHVHGKTITGGFHATYDDGRTLDGRIEMTRAAADGRGR